MISRIRLKKCKYCCRAKKKEKKEKDNILLVKEEIVSWDMRQENLCECPFINSYKLVPLRGEVLIQQGGKNKGDYDNDSRIAVANPGDKFRVSKERILLIVPPGIVSKLVSLRLAADEKRS